MLAQGPGTRLPAQGLAPTTRPHRFHGLEGCQLVAPCGGQVLPLFENNIEVPVDLWGACRGATRRRRSARVKKMNKKESGETTTPETQAMVKKVLDQHSYNSGHLRRNQKRQRDEQVRVLVQSKGRFCSRTSGTSFPHEGKVSVRSLQEVL